MSTLTQLKYLAAYYLRHHTEPQDLEPLEEEFIDYVANEVLVRMPTADLEKIRQFMVAGNVNEWVPLGQIIDEALNPLVEDDDDDGHDYVDRIQEEHDYKFGDWRL